MTFKLTFCVFGKLLVGLNNVNIGFFFNHICRGKKYAIKTERLTKENPPKIGGFWVKDRVRTGDLWIHKPAL
jgi:hypothetical protein